MDQALQARQFRWRLASTTIKTPTQECTKRADQQWWTKTNHNCTIS